MSTRKARKPREEKLSAVVIAFPVIARREIGASAKLPFPVVPVRSAEHIRSNAAPDATNETDRPALPAPRRGRWWETAIAISVLAHACFFFALWERNNDDLERAAGAAAAAADDGTVVIPVEVIVNAALPSAPVPVQSTTPDEKQVAKPSAEEQKNKKKEKTEAAPPQKSDEALEVMPTAKESLKPEKEKHEQKKESSKASNTAAASPNHAAGAHSHGRAGAGGRRMEAGGSANVSSYRMQVYSHLQRYKSSPGGAAPSRPVVVRFTLSASGGVISAGVGQSSGAPAFDQAAVSMVRRASPFPPIPAGLGISTMAINAPIRFQ